MPPNPKFLVVGLTLVACSFSPEIVTEDATDSPQQSCEPVALDLLVDELVEEQGPSGLYDLYLPCAQAGDAEAQLNIAILIIGDIDREIVDKGKEERELVGRDWLVRAARGGAPEAAAMLAAAYRYGRYSLPKNEKLATCWDEAQPGRRLPQQCEDMEADLLDIEPD